MKRIELLLVSIATVRLARYLPALLSSQRLQVAQLMAKHEADQSKCEFVASTESFAACHLSHPFHDRRGLSIPKAKKAWRL